AGAARGGGAPGAPRHRVRVVVINKSRSRRKTVTVTLPAGAGRTATVERMLAPSAAAKQGVSLGARSYGATPPPGELRPAELAPATVARRRVTLSVPRASAA